MNLTAATVTTASTAVQEEDEEEEAAEDDEERTRVEWDFSLSAIISPHSHDQVSDVLGAIEVDPYDRLLATGGIARKIRIYSLSSSTPAATCDFYICAPAKLSSLRWRPGAGLGAGDYDGVVTEYDLERRIPVSERDEHGGRRVWSVDYSADGRLGASASDDGTAQLWDPRSGDTAGACGGGSGGAPVCSAEFEKADGVYLGLGCADRRAYLYDLRRLAAGPVTVFGAHGKTVTYVRFVEGGMAVSSGVDGAHRMWEYPSGREVRAYRGHRNARSFVGMGVCRGGGLIGCGSESNEVYVYDLRWGEPIWVGGFGAEEEGGGGFVSAVCWREVSEDECGLIAGGSNGEVQMFVGRRRKK